MFASCCCMHSAELSVQDIALVSILFALGDLRVALCVMGKATLL